MVWMIFYRLLTMAFCPFVPLFLKWRLRRGKEDADRLEERRGGASCGRPQGALIWFHTASVGESVAVLALVKHILKSHPKLNILVTSGTVTSANILSQRLPRGAIHQFIPVDTPQYVDRFLNHWTPDMAIFVESEIWPNLIERSHKRGICLALINARMSKASEQQWQRFYGLIRYLSNMFHCVLSASQNDGARLQRLGFNAPRAMGNIKLFADPLPYDESLVDLVHNALAGRTLWAGTCLHAEDDAIVIAAHQAVLAAIPNSVVIMAPRHPERADDLQKQCEAQGWSIVRLYTETNEMVNPEHLRQADVILVDVVGRMGDVYALIPVVYLGGGFAHRGGHNPMEPLRQGCVVVQGRDTANCSDAVALLETHKLGVRAYTPSQVNTAVVDFLTHPDRIVHQVDKAQTVCQSLYYILQDTADVLIPLIEQSMGTQQQSVKRKKQKVAKTVSLDFGVSIATDDGKKPSDTQIPPQNSNLDTSKEPLSPKTKSSNTPEKKQE